MNKMILISLLLLPIFGQASETLRCIGRDAEYSLAFIYSTNNGYEIRINYDLDVPGGALGFLTWSGKGSITASQISIELDNGRFIKGNWTRDSYETIVIDDRGDMIFDCK